MESNLQVGDVVRVKSGGPKMTIAYLEKDNKGNTIVTCTWFVEAKRSEEVFIAATLQKEG